MNSFHYPNSCSLLLVGALLLTSAGRSSGSSSTVVAPRDSSTVASASSGKTEAANAVLTPPPREQIISPRLAANLASRLPRYLSRIPQSESASVGKSASAVEALSDDPAAFLLPKIVVHGIKPIVLRERDISTERGVVGVALKRYSSQLDQVLNHFRLPIIGISPEARSLALYAEDERLKERAGLERIIRLGAMADGAEGIEMRRLMYAANH